MSAVPQAPLARVDRPLARRAKTDLETNQAAVAIFPGNGASDAPVQAIVKCSERGIIRSALVRVPLSKDNGDLYMMGGFQKNPQGGDDIWVKKPVITALGYDKCNLTIGVSFITPKTVMDDEGQERSNPFIFREGRDIRFVRSRQVGIGRNMLGNLVAHDLTVTYDVGNYLAQDLMSMWSGKKKEATREWGVLMPAGLPAPAETEGDTKKAKPVRQWHGYEIPGGLTLWVDLRSKDVIALVSEHLNRQKFAERNAVTICRRNILKRFVARTTPDEKNCVPVVGWMDCDRDLQLIGDMAAQANEGKVNIGGDEISIVRDHERVEDPDEVNAALAGEDPEDGGPQGDDEGDEPPAPGVDIPAGGERRSDAELDALRARIRELAGRCDAEAIDYIWPSHELSGLSKIAGETDAGKLQSITKALEEHLLKATQAESQKRTPKSKSEQGKMFEGGRDEAFRR